MKTKGVPSGLLILFCGWLGSAQAGSLITNPVIIVSPPSLNFGLVTLKSSATNTFLIENGGGGHLLGQATVAPPFKIISGGKYNLTGNEVQVMTIVYRPSGAPLDARTVKFTGARGASVPVVGRPLPAPRTDLPKPK